VAEDNNHDNEPLNSINAKYFKEDTMPWG